MTAQRRSHPKRWLAIYLAISVLCAAAIVMVDKLVPGGNITKTGRIVIVVLWMIVNTFVVTWFTRKLSHSDSCEETDDATINSSQ